MLPSIELKVWQTHLGDLCRLKRFKETVTITETFILLLWEVLEASSLIDYDNYHRYQKFARCTLCLSGTVIIGANYHQH
jgi:hypothetical protein